MKLPENSHDLSVCIVNWNTRDLLRNCLKSITDHDRKLKVEILVVDNASTDGSVNMIRHEFPHVRLLENIENIGFGAANNQLFRRAHGRYILILNPDTLLLPETLAGMIEFLDQHPRAGAIGCRLINPDGSLQYSIRRFPGLFTAFTENKDLNWLPVIRTRFNRSRLFEWDHAQIREVDQPMGAAIMLRRSVLETLGGFDERYHMFFEDVDLCYHIHNNGWKIYYIPDVSLIHIGGASVKKHPRIAEEFYRSLLKFYHKHRSPGYFRMVRCFLALFSLLQLGFTPILLVTGSRRGLEAVKSLYRIFLVSLTFRPVIEEIPG